MTLLELVKAFTERTGLPNPVYVIGNLDQTTLQVKALLDEVAEDLVRRFRSWTPLTQEAVFTTVAAESQGILTTLAPRGFLWVLGGTLYNRTTGLELKGVLTPEAWQGMKALGLSGPSTRYRIVRGELFLYPAPAAGETCAFEYASDCLVRSADGTLYRTYATEDTDVFLLDSVIVLAGLRWKWKYEKGLDYAEEYRRYEELVNGLKGLDGTKPTLSMESGPATASPGVVVPSGNWSLP